MGVWKAIFVLVFTFRLSFSNSKLMAQVLVASNAYNNALVLAVPSCIYRPTLVADQQFNTSNLTTVIGEGSNDGQCKKFCSLLDVLLDTLRETKIIFEAFAVSVIRECCWRHS